jgi:hypothetical protein
VQLLVKIADGDSAVLNFDVAVVSTDTWTETNVNWNNKPASGATVGHIGNTGIASLNVGNLNSALADKILTLCLFDSQNQDSLMNIWSREAAANLRPILRVTV